MEKPRDQKIKFIKEHAAEIIPISDDQQIKY